MLNPMVRWVRLESDELVLQVREDLPVEGQGIKDIQWKHYTESRLFVPDNTFTANGSTTFTNCVKHGYIALNILKEDSQESDSKC